jgi:hypothetical protein
MPGATSSGRHPFSLAQISATDSQSMPSDSSCRIKALPGGKMRATNFQLKCLSKNKKAGGEIFLAFSHTLSFLCTVGIALPNILIYATQSILAKLQPPSVVNETIVPL